MLTRGDVARQVVDLSKATFDNLYFSVDTLQRMLEDLAARTAADAPWLPAELAAIVGECAAFAQRTREDLKDTVDRCHGLMHALIDRQSPLPEAVAPGSQDAATIH